MAKEFRNIETDFSSLQADEVEAIQGNSSEVVCGVDLPVGAELLISPESQRRIVEQRDKLRQAINSCRYSFSSHDDPVRKSKKDSIEAPMSDITLASSNGSLSHQYRIIRSGEIFENLDKPSTNENHMPTYLTPTISSKKKLSKRQPEATRMLDGNSDHHDYSEKPGWSYPFMVALAMFHSERGCLTVSEVYTFIEEHFPYFRTAPACWKNSVRHNLSLNRCFEKCEESSNGRGLLWRIVEDKKEKLQNDILKWRERHSERTNLGSATRKDLCKILRKSASSCSSESSMSEQWVESEETLSSSAPESENDYLEQPYFETEAVTPTKVEPYEPNLQSAVVQFHTPVKEAGTSQVLSPENGLQSPTTNRYHQCGGVYDSVCHALDENSLMYDAFQ